MQLEQMRGRPALPMGQAMPGLTPPHPPGENTTGTGQYL
jgi:hypothetical protein